MMENLYQPEEAPATLGSDTAAEIDQILSGTSPYQTYSSQAGGSEPEPSPYVGISGPSAAPTPTVDAQAGGPGGPAPVAPAPVPAPIARPYTRPAAALPDAQNFPRPPSQVPAFQPGQAEPVRQIPVPSAEERLQRIDELAGRARADDDSRPPKLPTDEGEFVPVRKEPETSGIIGTTGKALGRGLAGLVDMVTPGLIDASIAVNPALGLAYRASQAGVLPKELSSTVDNLRNYAVDNIHATAQWVQEKLPPTVDSYENIKSTGDALTWGFERLTQMAPQGAAMIASGALGPAAPLVWGYLGGAYGVDKANKETNGNPLSMAIGGITSAILNGAPVHLLQSPLGKTIIGSMASFGTANAALAGAGQLLESAPKNAAIADNFQDFMKRMSEQDWPKFVEQILTGGLQGLVLGAAGRYAAGKKTADVVPPISTDPAVAAAMRQTLSEGTPKPQEATASPPVDARSANERWPGELTGAAPPVPGVGAPGAPAGAPPSPGGVALAGVLPGLPPTAAERGIAPPVPAPPVRAPGELTTTLPGLPPTAGERGVPAPPMVRTPAEIGRQQGTVEQARQGVVGDEGVIPGSTPTPLERSGAPRPPLSTPDVIVTQYPQQTEMPLRGGTAQMRLPGVEPEIAAAVEGRAPPQPELPLGPEQRTLPLESGRVPPAAPEPLTPPGLPGVPREATQGELPGVPAGAAQGELTLPPGAPGQRRAPGTPAGQPELPIGDQPSLPFKLKAPETWRTEADDQTPGQFVVKAGNDVLAVGSSPEEAMQIARQRADQTPDPKSIPVEEPKTGTTQEQVPTVGKETTPPTEKTAPTGTTQEPKPATELKRPELISEIKALDPTTPGPTLRRENVSQLRERLETLRGKAEEAPPVAEPKATVAETVTKAQVEGTPVGPALMTRAALERSGLIKRPKPPTEIIPEKPTAHVAEPTEKTSAELAAERLEADKNKPRESNMAREIRLAAQVAERQKGVPTEGAPGYAETKNYQTLYRRATDEVMNRTKTVAKAVEEFAPMGRGRTRTTQYLDHLEGELARATDPETLLRFSEQRNRAATKEAQREIDEKIGRLVKLRENEEFLRKEIFDERQTTALDSLTGNLDAEIEALKRGPLKMRPAAPDRRVANRYMAPGVDTPLQRIYDRIAESKPGTPVQEAGASIHEVLDAVADHRALATAGLQQTRVLAKLLRNMLPENVRVMTEDAAQLRYGLEPTGEAYYAPTHDVIVVPSRMQGVSHVETVLHEAVHAATAHYIDNALAARTAGRATPQQTRHLEALEAIQAEVKRVGIETRITGDERVSVDYAASNLHELTSSLLTDPYAQEVMARTKPSQQFTAEMTRLGYGEAEKANLWTAFKGFVRRVFNAPAGSENVLDHAMRALGDVVESGARYRGAPEVLNRIADVRMRDALTPTAYALYGRPLTERARDAITENLSKTRSSTGEAARFLEHNGANVDAMVRDYGHLFPDGEFAGHRAAMERQASVARSIQRENEPAKREIDRAVADLAKVQYEGKSGDRYLGDFSNRVGYLDASMKADPSANAHLTTDAQRTQLAQLQAEFKRMPEAMQEVYFKRLEIGERRNAKEREAELDASMRMAMPESTPADRKAAYEQFNTRSGTRAFLDDPDASPLARAMGERYLRDREMVGQVAELMEMSHVQGDYFRLRRHGEYVVTHGERGTEGYGNFMFETRYEAERGRAALLAEGKDPSPVGRKGELNLRNEVNPRVADQLENAMRRRGADEVDITAARDAFMSIYLKHATDREARRVGARREGVLGASDDIRRIDNEEHIAHAHRMGWLASSAERMATLEKMQSQTNYWKRNGTDQQSLNSQSMVDQMRRRLPSIEGDDTDKFLNNAGKMLTNYGFVGSLLRPARLPIEFAGFHAVNQSLLGGEYTQGAAVRATAEAQRLAGITGSLRLGGRNMIDQMMGRFEKVNWENGRVLADRMIENGASPEMMNRIYQRLGETNLIDVTHARSAAEMARPGSNWNKVASVHERFVGGLALMDHAVETMQRMVAAHAAASLELARNGGDLNAAVEKSVDHLRVVTPNWNAYNAPWVASARGPLGFLAGPAFQFRNYGLHALGLYGSMIKRAIQGGTEGERGKSLKSMAGMIGYHALLGGIGVPVLGELAQAGVSIYDMLTGRKRPHDLSQMTRRFFGEQLGPTAGTLISRGLPALAGVDVSSSLTQSNLLMLPVPRTSKVTDIVSTMLTSVFGGAAGMDLAGAGDAAIATIRGNPYALIRTLPLRMARDIGTAIEWGTGGLHDARGRVILPSSQISTGALVAKTLGFNPTEISNFREGRGQIIDQRDEISDARSLIVAKAEQSGVGSVGHQVSAFNQRYPANRITYDSLIKAVREYQKDVATPRTFGVHVPRKQLQQAREAVRYLP